MPLRARRFRALRERGIRHLVTRQRVNITDDIFAGVARHCARDAMRAKSFVAPHLAQRIITRAFFAIMPLYAFD